MLHTPYDYATASRHLATVDEDWARLIQRVGPCTMELRPAREPFEALVRAVAYQQLHGRAAAAILGRFLALFPGDAFPEPRQLLAQDVDTLRTCGFSHRKITTIRGLAEARLEGRIPDLEAAAALPDEELIGQLVQLSGIGRWTVEILLIYTLGRPDVMPADDFGVRSGYRWLKGLDTLPTASRMRQLGAVCAPYRSVAAWYLWRAADLGKG
ncbi:DNA-3-methyladenine glycosylase II [Natronocella acetinitrilica]|uniref:DNA-3-methyladenine glycosylase II n=1 Tax=Natronocella acetinitrilica TaxID=414046 RepID=A0AAE3KAZ8_9GAMM|nr:DNA-3-methyladenine glycosylase [Natronocella acetinitrilica]MCP1673008.1 DNA-3-methyladenine glycosylase II [Natronocella acetinitrilica]